MLKRCSKKMCNSKEPNRESMFQWSPLPKKKLFCQQTSKELPDIEEDLYPNCDVNIWLRSCEKEILEPLEGKIFGNIPLWLKGTLYRNGPGSIKVGDYEFKHLFDSSALLHRFAINYGRITYQCRFLQSDVFKKNHAAKRIVVTEFGTTAIPDPCQTIFERVASFFDKDVSDNAMISVYPFGDEMYAFTESPIIHSFNKVTLETEKRLDVSQYVTIINHTSHPHVMEDRSVYNLAMNVTKTGLTHNIVHFPAKEKKGSKSDDLSMFKEARIVATVPARWYLHPSYMHTFGITENYFIIVEQPLTISVPAIVKSKLKNEAMASNFRWYMNEMTQFHVISKETGRTSFQFYSEAFFFLHIINQYEISDEYIVIDICCYRDPSILDCMYIETMRSMQKNPDYAKMFRGRPMRFVLPLKTKHCKQNENLVLLTNINAQAFLLPNGNIYVKPEQLCNLGCETPRIYCDAHLGKEYRYFYAISSDVDCNNPGTIIKVDTATKTCLTWCEENCYPSEPIFVPNPDCKNEDDGLLLSALVWGKNETNQVGLLILDAVTFKEIGRAVFKTSSPVPKCLHGWFSNTTY